MMFGLFLLAVGLLAGPAWAGELLPNANLMANKFLVGVQEVRTLAGPGGSTVVGELGSETNLWTLTAELRDANCPGCQFPDFLLPPSFDCSFPGPLEMVGTCTDGKWLIRQGTAARVDVSITDSFDVGQRGFSQDTLQNLASCSQEYNLFVSQNVTQQVALGELKGLLVRFYHRVNVAAQADNCPSPFNVVGMLLGVKLVNSATGQVFNYQVETFDSRGFQFDGSYWSFQAQSGETVYGVADSPEVYGEAALDMEGTGKVF